MYRFFLQPVVSFLVKCRYSIVQALLVHDKHVQEVFVRRNKLVFLLQVETTVIRFGARQEVCSIRRVRYGALLSAGLIDEVINV